MQKKRKNEKNNYEKESKKFPFFRPLINIFLEMQIRLLLHAQGYPQRMRTLKS